jgi:hypothetical protein
MATAHPSLTSAPRWWADPLSLIELFLIGNVGFLAVDIYVAHAINQFANPYEWIPIYFSGAATFVLLVALALGGPRPAVPGDGRPSSGLILARWLGLLVAAACIVVGVAGVVFHLRSHFFDTQTLQNLVYTAPFAAPLAYTGLGLVLILNRTVSDRLVDWSRSVILLAMGGFVGNFVLSLADHAQNDFFATSEWIPVVSAALAVGFLFIVALRPYDARLRHLTWAVMGLQMVVGLIGFGLHVMANLSRPGTTLWEQFVYGAPAMAPMLFADMAILALLGLWALEAAVARDPAPFDPRAVPAAV